MSFPDNTRQTTAYTGPQTTLDGDVTGSVFADDSTLLVDGVAGKIVGTVSYSPSTDAHWTDPNPTTVADALNRLAAAIYAANGGSSI